MTRVDIKPGERGYAVMPHSEVCMHFRVAGKPMAFGLLGDLWRTPGMVQLYHDDGRPFSAPITSGEAGVYEDEAGYYYYALTEESLNGPT
jgi:hypothetical protein